MDASSDPASFNTSRRTQPACLSQGSALTFVDALPGNGVLSLFIAPPPSMGFPFQDITHIGVILLVLGISAVTGQVRAAHSFE